MDCLISKVQVLFSLLLVILTWQTSSGIEPQGTAIPLSDIEEGELVSAHNFFRGMVDPTASNMQTLVWNKALAEAAENFSLLCRPESNPERASQVPGFDTVGENWTAVGTQGLPNFTSVINAAWFSQRLMYSFQDNTCTTTNACLFYTQLVWANTTDVGCGISRCPMIPGFPIPNSVLLVCYYGPEGNIAGERPYLMGEPCSLCPTGQENCVQNLCSEADVVTTMTTAMMTTVTPTNEEATPTNEEDTPTIEEDGEESSSSSSSSGISRRSSQFSTGSTRNSYSYRSHTSREYSSSSESSQSSTGSSARDSSQSSTGSSARDSSESSTGSSARDSSQSSTGSSLRTHGDSSQSSTGSSGRDSSQSNTGSSGRDSSQSNTGSSGRDSSQSNTGSSGRTNGDSTLNEINSGFYRRITDSQRLSRRSSERNLDLSTRTSSRKTSGFGPGNRIDPLRPSGYSSRNTETGAERKHSSMLR